MHLAILGSHPIQYQAPLFRELARQIDVTVFYAHRATQADQAAAGFGIGFEWDVDLLSGYEYHFLQNVAVQPGLDHFWGCDTPSVRTRLACGRFDALLVLGWHLKCFWQAIFAAKRQGIPVMVRGDSHLETPRSRLKRCGKAITYPIALRIFDVGLYVGERSRRYWEHYGYPREQLIFSPQCVDNDWFAQRATRAAGAELRRRHGVPLNAKVALFAGKLLPFKRPLDLVAAAGLLSAEGYDMTILFAGSGPEAEEIDAVGRAKNVHIVQLGFCNQSEIPAAYAAADCLVLPSGHETWGLVANEALAAGRPILVSDACGCAPDLAADRTAGQIAPVGDVPAIAGALRDLLERGRPPDRIAAKARAYSITAASEGVVAAMKTSARGRFSRA